MRRLHPRGAANRGLCVDADGAMLGPDCVLVHKTAHGYRAIGRGEAAALQAAFLAGDREQDWLFKQTRRIADALDDGELALAQIYGLRIPVGVLDDRQLRRLGAARLTKTGFNPDEPRIPQGDPHGGEWTTGEDAGGGSPASDSPALAGGADEGDDEVDNAPPFSDSSEPAPSGAAAVEGARSAEELPTPDSSPIEAQPDDNASIEMVPPGAADTDNVSPPSDNSTAPKSPTETVSSTGNPNSPPNRSVQSDNASGGKLPDDWSIDIPDEAPTSTQQINRLLRNLATWLARAAAVLGAAYSLDPEVEVALAAVEGGCVACRIPSENLVISSRA
jgi:hypothetical protein